MKTSFITLITIVRLVKTVKMNTVMTSVVSTAMMKMLTKKHFIAIAEIIKSWTIEEVYVCKDILVESLAMLFAQENPRFDIDKFYKACEHNVESVYQCDK